MTFHQQIDVFGGLHDLGPEHESMRLFTADPQIRGQIALDTDDDRDGYRLERDVDAALEARAER